VKESLSPGEGHINKLDTFAFIIHPIDPKRDVGRKYPLLGRFLNVKQIDFFSTYFPPVYISQIDGLRSAATGKEVKGWFVACPLTPARMLQLPESAVYRKIVDTGKLAERLGAQLLGLGAFTSVVGDAGLTISRQLSIPVTTGDSYTIAVAVEAARAGAHAMGISVAGAAAAVVGATGAVGTVAAELLARDVAKLWLIGKRTDRLEALREGIMSRTPAQIEIATDMAPLAEADVILTVTSALDAVIEPEHLRPGAVVCDVARPRDVSARVAAARDDVLVIDGGMVQVPGTGVQFNFDFGFPAGLVYACMAETMALALEGRFESFTLGRNITVDQVHEIAAIANKHGFRLAGFRSFERALTQADVERVAQRASAARVRTARAVPEARR
jgi:fatty aldehyde-generating acyl-ACP reductase